MNNFQWLLLAIIAYFAIAGLSGGMTPKASASRQPVPKCFVKEGEISDRKLLKAILIATGSKNPFGYPNRNNLSALAAALCEDPTYLDD